MHFTMGLYGWDTLCISAVCQGREVTAEKGVRFIKCVLHVFYSFSYGLLKNLWIL